MDRISPSRFITPFRYEKFVKTPNNSGGSNETYEPITNARGEWLKCRGNRELTYGNDTLVNTYKVNTFWRAELDNQINKDTRLIKDDGGIYRIEEIRRAGEKRQYYQFIVSEAH